ncbi:MAG: DNA polymerase [Thermoprotei archaeon ex4572_64]|nr:MAG: DNA polymerase [Thermoprotei archaeon ex4572_64]
MFGIDEYGRRVLVLDRSFRPYFYAIIKDNIDEGKVKKKLEGKALSIESCVRKLFGREKKVLKIVTTIPAKVKELREYVRSLSEVEEVVEADIRFYMRYMIDMGIKPSSWIIIQNYEEIKNPYKYIDGVYLVKSKPEVVEDHKVPKLKMLAFDIEVYNPKGMPNPERDPIIIITTMNSDGKLKTFIASDERNDRVIIKEFVNYVKEYNPDVILGYNSNNFDIPYLVERCEKLGIKFDISRVESKPEQSVYGHWSIIGRANIDLYNFIEDIPELKVKSLDYAAEYFGIMKRSERVLIPGHRVYEYWSDKKKRELLIKYAIDDVVSTYKLGEKFLPYAIQLSSISGLNIMMKYNISPDTYVEPWEEIDDYYEAPEVHHRFRKQPKGLYPEILEELVCARRRVRELMNKFSEDSSEWVFLNERQRALKIMANAMYGYCGWLGARWYRREVAEAVTAWARTLLKDVINYARKIGLQVIYGDTDSLFVKYREELIGKLVNYVEKELGFEIKIDRIYRRVLFTEAKKRYAGLTIDDKIDVVGFETVRGDWADIAKDLQEKVVEIILREGNIEKALKLVYETIERLKKLKFNIDEVIIWKTLDKSLSEYKVLTPHVAAAKKLIEHGYKVGKGDAVGFVITKQGGSKLAYRAKPYILIKDLNEIDINYYIEKQVLPAVMRILKVLGVREDEVLSGRRSTSILDYFT